MKVTQTAVNRILEAIGREISVMRSTDVPENEIIIYIPGYILLGFQLSFEGKVEKGFKWKPDFTYKLFGASLMPGYEQSKIIISNTVKKIYPNCIRRVEIHLHTGLKDNIISFSGARYYEETSRKIPINDELDTITVSRK